MNPTLSGKGAHMNNWGRKTDHGRNLLPVLMLWADCGPIRLNVILHSARTKLLDARWIIN
jgi:hypothetical protein